jgi:NADPH:quinone reductase
MEPTTVSVIRAVRLAFAPVRAIRIEEWGGPEVLEYVEDHEEPVAGDGELLVRVSRAGVNFADTHAREDVYVSRYGLPMVPGAEVAGTVEGDGRRVVALTGGTGGYAELAAVPADSTFDIPDGVSDAVALGLLIQGLTAWHLYRTAAKLARGESVVVHSAAGGTGSLALQLARPLGAGRVIATASSEDKRALARELGADAVVDVTREDLADAIVEANDGRPVDVVLEAAGGRVFDASLDALAPFGRVVVYGISSRQSAHPSTGHLMKHSKAVVGFWLFHCLADPRRLVAEPLADLLARAARGELRVLEGETYPLSEARRAHEDLTGRRTTGKLLLDPRF